MRKPLNARSTQFVKSRPARERLLARTRQAVRADTPSADLISLAHGVSLSTRHCGSARASQTHPLRVNAPTRVKHTIAAARLCC
jgi:hypothetical protein